MPDDPDRTRSPLHHAIPAPAPTPPLRVVVADDNPVVRAGLTALLSGREDITVVAEAADGRAACEAADRHCPDVVLLDVRMPGVDGISALPYLVGIAPVIMLTYSRESEIVREALRRGAGGYLVHGEFTADQLVTALRDVREGRAHVTPTAAGALLARLREEEGLPEGLGGGRQSANAHALPKSTPLGPPPDSAISAHPLSQLQPSVGQSSSGTPDRSSFRSRFQLSTREAEIMDLIASGMNNQQIAAACFISEKTVKNHINRIFAKLHSTSRAEAAAKWLGAAPDSRRAWGDPR
ncbi:response regulator transcription factor [Streptomyces sp. TRM S81-3]|uniref:Response regulator transcription factor n=1 Tax=Streptomyces griseicoloratus TaxID=2752516 RepID=A0A926L5E7_9ACTN|nr:response regulator transcription factor [Streptomyces griseicoloratus]MBD0422927.1 response regulator transcription factor [Streptomyces griseicoloratus]